MFAVDISAGNCTNVTVSWILLINSNPILSRYCVQGAGMPGVRTEAHKLFGVITYRNILHHFMPRLHTVQNAQFCFTHGVLRFSDQNTLY